MKKMLCIILAVIMALSFSGCIHFGHQGTDPTAAPTEAVTERPTAAPTAVPTEAPTPEPTEDPFAADRAFEELDLYVFQTLVTSGTEAYNQYIVGDPAQFGIDPEDVTPGWGSISYEEHVRSMDFYREVIGRLEEIDFEKLNDMNRLGYTAIKTAFENELKFEDYYYYDEPLEPMNGYHTMLPLSLLLFNVRTHDDIESYMYLVEDLERFLGELETFEEGKAEHGVFMCEKALDQVVESCRDFAAKGEDCFLITCFDEDFIEKAKAVGATDAECEELIARNREAVLEHVLPAYSRLADTLEAHRGDCSEFVGASERGDEAMEYYRLKLLYEGATNDDADDVADMLEEMGNKVYMDLVSALFSVAGDALENYGEPVTRGSVEDNLAWLEDFIKKYYPGLPDYSLTFTTVPEDIADDFSPAAYLTPAFDDYYNNIMLLNPSEDNPCDLFTVAHEAVPGHMYQYLYTRSLEGMSLSQQLLEPTGYAEAWTVFTEFFVADNYESQNRAYAIIMNADSTFANIFMPAYTSVLVNLYGYDEDDLSYFLNDYGLADYTDVYYEYAITLPFSSTSYAVGYAYLRAIYDDAAPRGNNGHRAFFEKYLGFGPNFMDVITEYMQ